jgi:hypothetical protein
MFLTEAFLKDENGKAVRMIGAIKIYQAKEEELRLNY